MRSSKTCIVTSLLLFIFLLSLITPVCGSEIISISDPHNGSASPAETEKDKAPEVIQPPKSNQDFPSPAEDDEDEDDEDDDDWEEDTVYNNDKSC